MKTKNLLKEVIEKSDKIVLCSAKPNSAKPNSVGSNSVGSSSVGSNWGHYESIMPCAETPESAKYAIETLSLDRTNVFGVCIHHTDTKTADAARKVLKDKKLSTHFIIDKNGDTTVELPLDKRAAACVGFNKWMWQIDVVGRLHKEEPTDEQISALTNLLKLLSCGRKIENIDKKFADKCRKMTSEEVQKETPKKYNGDYEKISKKAQKTKSWSGVLDKVPFTVIYHGEVRPTACCGKYLINKIPEILSSLSEQEP